MPNVEIIAEVSTSHGGDLGLAKAFIWMFAPYVSTIKFQLTRAIHLRPQDPQYGWFTRSELTLDQFAELQTVCWKAGVGFLLTVYHAADVWEVKHLGCSRVKIGSGEAHQRKLQHAVAEAELRPIVSCGLTLEPKGWFEAQFLGCCTRYPAPAGIAAAKMVQGFYQGWSDHAEGLGELKAAVAMGATLVETHVQLPDQARPTSGWEKTVDEMRTLRTFVDDNPARFIGRWQNL